MDWEDRIVANPKVLGGKPAVRGARISVALVCELLDAGSSIADILDSYPFLSHDDIKACRLYADKYGAAHRSQVKIDEDGIHLPGRSLAWDKALPLPPFRRPTFSPTPSLTGRPAG